MESDINEKMVGIYWDLNTCDSNAIELMAQKIRQLYVKTYVEKEFLCSTIRHVANESDLQFKHNIQFVYSSKAITSLNVLKNAIAEHVNECLICCQKPIVILITGDYCLANVLNGINTSAEVVLIYGQNLNQSLVRSANKCLPFVDLELMVMQMNGFSDRALVEHIFYPSFDNNQKPKVKNKWRQLNCFGRKRSDKPYDTVKSELKSESGLHFNQNPTQFVNDEEIGVSVDNYVKTETNSSNCLSKRFIAGVCGLTNLGNTCFMNSALQCLSNVPLFTQYAINSYQEMSSQNNKIESKPLFNFYCELISDLWSQTSIAISPKNFRLEVSKYFQQFRTHVQNDCSEFLILVLDRFHEELKQLNAQNKENFNWNEEIKIYNCFSDYIKDNTTIISILFHGFQRFSMSCDCGQTLISNCNPFVTLNLPHPNIKTNCNKKLTICFMPLNMKNSDFKIRIYEINTSNDKISVNWLLSQFITNNKNHSLNTVLSENNLIVTQICEHEITYIYNNNDIITVSQIKGELYIYETDGNFAKQVFINLRYIADGPELPFGIPLMININDCSFECINTAFKEQFFEYLPELYISESEQISKDLKSLYFVYISNENKFIDYNYYSWSYEFPNHQILYLKNISSFVKQKYQSPQKVKTHLSSNNIFNLKLEQYLYQYLSVKKLTENDKIYCIKCETNVIPNEKFDIIKAPNILLLQIKSNSSLIKQNIAYDSEYHCDYPLTLDFNKYVINSAENSALVSYHLIAISNYCGSNNSGHYTTFAKNHLNQKWYHFNDSSVEEIPQERVFTSKAFLLVYMKSDFFL